MKQLLEELGVHDPPVPVRKVARQCDARIVLVPGEEDKDLSGFLYRGSDHSIIGVNKDHVPVRQRFTIAHEIGHLLLHEHDQVHVDRGFRVRLRSDISSQGTDRDEMEANRFAAELLMPLKMLQADVQSLEFDLTGRRCVVGAGQAVRCQHPGDDVSPKHIWLQTHLGPRWGVRFLHRCSTSPVSMSIQCN